MDSVSDSFLFCQISSNEATEAFDFHLRFKNDEYIWPRTAVQLKAYSENGELFAIRNRASREIVGICYVTLDDGGKRWELGGLGVSEAFRSAGLGRVLIRFALARTIASNRPWFYKQAVIAHVHESNPAPRNALKNAGFEQNGQEVAPSDKAPASMKRNAAGDVVGDVFVLPQSAVAALITAIEKDFSAPLHDGKSRAVFDETNVWTLAMLLGDLKEAGT
jgi:ribosomal protein S18 acetylase RimI-like enzyme